MQTMMIDVNGVEVKIQPESRVHGKFEALPKRRVLFRVPKGADEEWVREKLDLSEMYVHDLVSHAPNGEVEPPREFVSGETVSVFGRLYRLKVVQDNRTPSVEIDGDRLLVFAGQSRVVRARLRKWMHDLVADEAKRCADDFVQRVGNEYDELAVKHYKRRLGSCTASGKMRFHWGIGLLPRSKFKTVIAHEVAHLKYPRHTDKFWSLLTSLAPKQKEHHDFFRKFRRWLEF